MLHITFFRLVVSVPVFLSHWYATFIGLYCKNFKLYVAYIAVLLLGNRLEH
jgi:hypothetical protein